MTCAPTVPLEGEPVDTASYSIPSVEQPAGKPRRDAPPRLPNEQALPQLAPPWLQRAIGESFLGAIGAIIDCHLTRLVDAVRLRFPSGSRTDALAVIGRERRILRGPGEDSVTYARRLRKWWDLHRTRGNSRAMLEQLYDYLQAALSRPMEVVDGNGKRHLVDAAGVITEDTIQWNADGTGLWARLWVMLNLADTNLPVPILDDNGEPVLDGAGDPTFTLVDIFALTGAEEALLCAVPRDWRAAHIEKTTIVLLHPGAELWGYRTTDDPDSGQAIGTWADDDPSPGQVWQPTDPVQIEC